MIEQTQAQINLTQASLNECNSLSEQKRVTWKGLEAELEGIEASLPGLYAQWPNISEAQMVAEKAADCPKGIPELQIKIINAQLLHAEWEAQCQRHYVETFRNAHVSLLNQNARRTAKNNYDNAFNRWYSLSIDGIMSINAYAGFRMLLNDVAW